MAALTLMYRIWDVGAYKEDCKQNSKFRSVLLGKN